jgi:hypothetical protein
MNKIYDIFIPSYDRPQTIKNTTLKLLTKHKIPNNIITIFVETESMKKEYNKILNNDYHIIVTNTKGIGEKRNFLELYGFQKSQCLGTNLQVLNIDDDIKEVIDYDKPADNLDIIIQIGFSFCRNGGYNLWGVSPFHNKFFLQKKITNTNKYIAGAFFGMIFDITKEMVFVDIDHGEDLQRSMECYLRDGGVVRLNEIALITDYFPNSGITAYCGGKEKRKIQMETNCKYLAQRYGDMCRLVENKWGFTVRLNSFFSL